MIDVDAYCEIDLRKIKVADVTFRYFKTDNLKNLNMSVFQDFSISKMYQDYLQLN